MSGVLVVAEARRGELRDITLELIGAGGVIAEAAGGRLAVAVIASDAGLHADRVRCEGVDEVLAVTSPGEHFEAHFVAHALETLIEQEQPSVVLTGFTIDSMGFAPAVAARLGLGFASDVQRLAWDDGPVATRSAYGGKLEVELDFPGHDCTLLMLRAGEFSPAPAGAGSAAVRAVNVAPGPDEAPTKHIEFRTIENDGSVDISESDFLLSIGRGVENEDDVPQFAALAERMGATLSGSRPLVDAGWIAGARQVGQSGRTVRPKVYLALGISGAVQHLAGIRGADTIIAVNTDPEAPIFGVADYGVVADLFEVAEQLEQRFE